MEAKRDFRWEAALGLELSSDMKQTDPEAKARLVHQQIVYSERARRNELKAKNTNSSATPTEAAITQ